MICRHCGKEIPGEGMSFCPYCGVRLEAPEENPVSREAAAWIDKALKVKSYPERKKILEQAKKVCPEDPAIDWELLFIGTPDPKPPKGVMDFSIIRCWMLQIYRTPGNFPKEKRDAMRQELFSNPQLLSMLEASGNPEGKMREYLLRLCREYIEIFLRGDNRLMGNFLGIRLGRNTSKILEEAVSGMIRQIETDEQLTTEQRKMLAAAMIQAMGKQ